MSKSFSINVSFYPPIAGLSDEQLGRLFRSIFKYHLGEPVEIGSDISMAFEFFKVQFDADEKKAKERSRINSENGKKGGAQPGNKNAQKAKPAKTGETSEIKQNERNEQNQAVACTPVDLPKKNPKQAVNPKTEKKQYADYVRMTEAEYAKLVNEYGEEGAKELVTILDNYKAASGKRYKEDYRAILNWVVREYLKRNNNSNYATNNERRSNDRRTGVEVSATSAEDYKGAF